MMSIPIFREHVWPLRDRLYRLAYRLLGERAEAEDVVQETMIKIWEKRDSLADIRNLEAWCLRLVHNQGIDRYRSRRSPQTLENAPVLVDSAPDPAHLMQSQDLQLHIDRLVQQLPAQRRLVLHLREAEGKSYQEIAAHLNISLDQARIDLHRARVFLRTALSNYPS